MNIQATEFLDLSLKMYDLAKKRDHLQRYIDRDHTRSDSERNENNEEMAKINDEIEEIQKKMNAIIEGFGKKDKMAAIVVQRVIAFKNKTAKVYILYHGSKKDIKPEDLEEYCPSYQGSLGKGIYFGQNRETAEFYGAYVLEVKADLKNPLIIDAGEGINYRIAEEIREHYETTGSYDSILVGESIAPFDIKIGGKWHEIRDAWDLKDIGELAKSAGHDAVIVKGIRERSSVNEEVLVFDKKSLIFFGAKKVANTKTADYPDHPDEIVIPGITEKDVFSYYEGVKGKMLSELKGREIFVGIVPKGYKVGQKPVYVRHPYDKKTNYIHINSIEDFDTYNGGRVVEIHVTMPPSSCPYYVVDFDAVGDWPTTKKITAEIADMLDKLPEVKSTEIRFSGKRGFHIIGNLKKPKPVAQAREDLKEHLKNTFGERKDLVIGESPKGNKGALGVSPMKPNGGQVALWSLRVTGLCCVEVPRAQLAAFKKEDATMERTYKKLTGKTFVSIEKKMAATRVINSFLKYKTLLLWL